MALMVSEIIEMVSELIDGKFEWVEIYPEFFGDTILKHGMHAEHFELGKIIANVKFVLEHATTIGQDFLQMNGMGGEAMEMV